MKHKKRVTFLEKDVFNSEHIDFEVICMEVIVDDERERDGEQEEGQKVGKREEGKAIWDVGFDLRIISTQVLLEAMGMDKIIQRDYVKWQKGPSTE